MARASVFCFSTIEYEELFIGLRSMLCEGGPGVRRRAFWRVYEVK